MLIKNKKTNIKSLVYGIYSAYSEKRYITFNYNLMIVDIETEKESEILDNTYSKYWVNVNNKFMPKEWYSSLFLEELVDNPAPLHDNIFRVLKEKIDKEFEYYDIFNNEDLTDIDAIKIGSNWVLCPECNDAFEVGENKKIVSCSNIACKIKLNNPYYIRIKGV